MQAKTVPETFRGYVLDGFQREAIAHLLEGASFFVAAPTGSGKTLIADYVVGMAGMFKRGVIYTAPIKALATRSSNNFGIPTEKGTSA